MYHNELFFISDKRTKKTYLRSIKDLINMSLIYGKVVNGKIFEYSFAPAFKPVLLKDE